MVRVVSHLKVCSQVSNLLSALPFNFQEEQFENLLMSDAVRIERIVSNGQATAEGHWYDQALDEWVLLLEGSAGLLFEGDEHPIVLGRGDYLLIPAHCRHRVVWTDAGQTTVWLALHFNANSNVSAAEVSA